MSDAVRRENRWRFHKFGCIRLWSHEPDLTPVGILHGDCRLVAAEQTLFRNRLRREAGGSELRSNRFKFFRGGDLKGKVRDLWRSLGEYQIIVVFSPASKPSEIQVGTVIVQQPDIPIETSRLAKVGYAQRQPVNALNSPCPLLHRHSFFI